MIQLCGRFRWELCRTMQGTSWNNIQIKSLTSEYSDYIQFYRKNRDLSEDKKEKLKMQIQKCRNNTREVFVTDLSLIHIYVGYVKLEKRGEKCRVLIQMRRADLATLPQAASVSYTHLNKESAVDRCVLEKLLFHFHKYLISAHENISDRE